MTRLIEQDSCGIFHQHHPLLLSPPCPILGQVAGFSAGVDVIGLQRHIYVVFTYLADTFGTLAVACLQWHVYIGMLAVTCL